MKEVVVVGAGPAGTAAARHIAASGREVTVLEQHPEPGMTAHCAGVVTADVIELSGVRPEVLSTISSADVVFPGGRTISVERRSPMAFVIDRSVFDIRMADAAARYGAEIEYGTHCSAVDVRDDGVFLETNRGEVGSELLVGADGQGSLLAMTLGDNAPREVIRGAQVDIKHKSDDQQRMVLRLGSEVVPGFFTWELPMGDLTRVGLCVGTQYGAPATYLRKLLNDSGYGDCEIVRRYGGKIPIGGRRTSYGERTLLIGDAAGQIKPVSGGGLYPILKSAPILADIVSRSFEKQIFTSAHLALYERGWKRELSPSFSRGSKIRKAFFKLTDAELDELAESLDTEGVREALSMIDLDDPADSLGPVLSQKGVKGAVFKAVLRSLL